MQPASACPRYCSAPGACPHVQAWPNSQAHQLLPTWHPRWCLAGGTLECGWGGDMAYGSQQDLLIPKAGRVGWWAQLPITVRLLKPSVSSLLLCPASRLLYVRLSSLYFCLPHCVSASARLSLCLCLMCSCRPFLCLRLSLPGCLDLSLSVSP